MKQYILEKGMRNICGNEKNTEREKTQEEKKGQTAYDSLSAYSESQKLLSDDYQEILAQRMAEGIFNKIKGDENS